MSKLWLEEDWISLACEGNPEGFEALKKNCYKILRKFKQFRSVSGQSLVLGASTIFWCYNVLHGTVLVLILICT